MHFSNHHLIHFCWLLDISSEFLFLRLKIGYLSFHLTNCLLDHPLILSDNFLQRFVTRKSCAHFSSHRMPRKTSLNFTLFTTFPMAQWKRLHQSGSDFAHIYLIFDVKQPNTKLSNNILSRGSRLCDCQTKYLNKVLHFNLFIYVTLHQFNLQRGSFFCSVFIFCTKLICTVWLNGFILWTQFHVIHFFHYDIYYILWTQFICDNSPTSYPKFAKWKKLQGCSSG